MTRSLRVIAVLAAAPLLLTASPPSAVAESVNPAVAPTLAWGFFTEHGSPTPSSIYGNTTPAYTYDTGHVPVDSFAAAHATALHIGGVDTTVVTLTVRGLQGDRRYGAHVHYQACGKTGADAGAHYQNVMDPAVDGDETVASTDPAYANAANEVWLDFRTDAKGNGWAQSVTEWRFRDDGARSIVIHDHGTSTGGDDPAGDAGARHACITVRF